MTSYYDEIIQINTKNKNAREHSYRTPLQNLWNNLYSKKFPILHEGSSENGTPDFTISNLEKHTIGFIECKDFGFKLDDAIKNKKGFEREYKQIIKYLTLSNVVIFTNYIEFILITMKDNKLDILDKVELTDNNIEELEKLFCKFVFSKPLEVKNQDEFIKLLAKKTQILRNDILHECEDEKSLFSKSSIHKLFSETIYRELDTKDFADSFAQIITFGLLFTRLTYKQKVDINTFSQMPEFIPIFREMLKKFDITEAGNSFIYTLESIISTVNIYDEAIFFDGKNYIDSHDKEDPFIYMYENFLKEFDDKTRNARGVFYTPLEAVNYIIRSIDEILKERLSIPSGFSSKEVHALDFATGTGTFLLGAIEHIYNEIKRTNSTGKWESKVSDFILQNLYGFEYLVVPYVLAHFRIHEYLKDSKYKYKREDRLKIYLTNTLDNTSPKEMPMFPELNEESSGADKIKNIKPILVIMGNPPYNSKSDEMNSKEWIMELTNTYKENLGEKKINLNDDYIKFLRFAHWKMESVEKGIVAVIVNNGFINGITYREMRNKLMQTFDEIYIYDLHGNVNKGEKCKDGSQDFNIFNIKDVGVCIAIFVKTGIKNNKNKGVYHQEIFGTQKHKKEALVPRSWSKDLKNKVWQKIEDDKKWHWFVPKVADVKYWESFIGLNEIFENINSGIETKRDDLFIDFDKEELNSRMNILSSGKLTSDFINKYNAKSSLGYEFDLKIKSIPYNNSDIKIMHYRPFDFRYICFNEWIGRTRMKAMKHLINHQNIGLVFPRQVSGAYSFQHGLVTNFIIDRATGGAKTGSETNIAPLYIYEKHADSDLALTEEEMKPNFTDTFSTFLNTYHTKEPETILAYIYAVLYSPTYRKKYAEDLAYDYPRIPFTQDKKTFYSLSKIGQKIIDLHLLKQAPKNIVGYPVSGDNIVKECSFDEAKNKLYINKEQYFAGVSNSVYTYSIGGYQVIKKYIDTRVDRTLTSEEITHIQNICGIIADTINLQDDIDKIIYKNIQAKLW